MTTRASISPAEAYWNEQKASLKNARSKGARLSTTPEGRANGFRPLANEHPLLTRSRANTRQSPVGRHTRTPPARLDRIHTPPTHQRFQHDSNVRSSKYGVIPPVKPKKNAYERDERPRSDGYDSWGEGGSDSEDERPPQPPYAVPYPGVPVNPAALQGGQYPVMMYPMVIPMQAPPVATSYPGHPKHKDGKPKKKVRYRETPIYMSSREHTRHTPAPSHRFHHGDTPSFDYIAPSDLDPFNPRENDVLRRYRIGTPSEYKSRTTIAREHMDKHPDFANEVVDRLVSELLEDEIIPDVLISAIEDEKEAEIDRRSEMKRFIDDAKHFRDDAYEERTNPVENFMRELIDDVVWEESFEVVTDAIHDLVDVHLAKAAAYDIIMELSTEIIQAEGPDIVRESIFDVILEDMILEDLIEPEVEEQAKEVVLETITHYNDKVRKKEIRQVEKDTGDKLVDSFALDYLLSLVARQSNTWTEGAYAEKALDRGKAAFVSSVTDEFLADTEDSVSVLVGGRKPITTDIMWDWMLTILLEQFLDVGRRRNRTIDNKPLRRHHEKVITDVALDTLLGEMCQSLDEDMGDLDEYETGLDDPENIGTPEHISSFFAGRR